VSYGTLSAEACPQLHAAFVRLCDYCDSMKTVVQRHVCCSFARNSYFHDEFILVFFNVFQNSCVFMLFAHVFPIVEAVYFAMNARFVNGTLGRIWTKPLVCYLRALYRPFISMTVIFVLG
jgi:hypothetical protein